MPVTGHFLLTVAGTDEEARPANSTSMPFLPFLRRSRFCGSARCYRSFCRSRSFCPFLLIPYTLPAAAGKAKIYCLFRKSVNTLTTLFKTVNTFANTFLLKIKTLKPLILLILLILLLFIIIIVVDGVGGVGGHF